MLWNGNTFRFLFVWILFRWMLLVPRKEKFTFYSPQVRPNSWREGLGFPLFSPAMFYHDALQWSSLVIACSFRFTLPKVANFKRNDKIISWYTWVFFFVFFTSTHINENYFPHLPRPCDRCVALFLYVRSVLSPPRPPLFFIVHLLSPWLPLSPGNKGVVGSILLGVCLGSLQVLCKFHEDNRLLSITCRCQCECWWLFVTLWLYEEPATDPSWDTLQDSCCDPECRVNSGHIAPW